MQLGLLAVLERGQPPAVLLAQVVQHGGRIRAGAIQVHRAHVERRAGWAFFAEIPAASTLIGAAVIIPSTLYVVWAENQKSKESSSKRDGRRANASWSDSLAPVAVKSLARVVLFAPNEYGRLLLHAPRRVWRVDQIRNSTSSRRDTSGLLALRGDLSARHVAEVVVGFVHGRPSSYRRGLLTGTNSGFSRFCFFFF